MSDLHDKIQDDIAKRAPYANGHNYVFGDPDREEADE